jgi:hypothetical protein
MPEGMWLPFETAEFLVRFITGTGATSARPSPEAGLVATRFHTATDEVPDFPMSRT